jgi:O-antigen ligase
MFSVLTSNRIALFLWSAIAVLPFLSPVHYLPQPQWWGEVSVVWLALGAWLLSRPGNSAVWPRATLWMLALALVWMVQPLFVPLAFPGLNTVNALAFVALALLAGVTADLRERFGLATVSRVLAWALLIGALLQSLIGLAQLTGLAQGAGDWLFYDSEHPTTNIFGHIGQRNQYAHYLVWGMIGAALLYARRALAAWAFAAVLIWLGLSIGWAGSRTVLLYAAAIAGLAVIWHQRLRTGDSRRFLKAFVAVALAIVLLQFVQPLVNLVISWFSPHSQVVASGIERLAANSDGLGARRFTEWHKAWLVFRANPGFGIGWMQYAAQSVNLQMLPMFKNASFNSGLFSNAHNLEIQLLAEMGGIGMLVAIGGFIWALWPYLSRKAEPEYLLPLAVLSVTLIHSQLEYPLWYLYFLAVLVMMTALAPAAPVRLRGLAGWGNAAMALGLAAVLAVYTPRYQELVGLYSPSGMPQRDAARAARLKHIVEHEPMLAFHALTSLENYISVSRVHLPEKIALISQLAAFRPYPDVMLKQARLLALAGRKDEAAAVLRRDLASFPTYAPDFLDTLDDSEPAYSGLIDVAQQAYDALPPAYQR